jgi:polysaccharide export outer membrane protein
MIIKKILLLLAAVIVAGCSSNDAPMQMPDDILDYSLEPYRIGVGDKLKIQVWGNEQLSLEVPVRPDGKISMPLIGDVLVASKTTEGLSQEITEQLQVFVKNPQVTVIVTNPSSSDFQQRVRVTGAVENPQSVPYRKGMTVLDLVLLAGGTNDFAKENSAKLYRRSAGEIKVYPVYLEKILQEGDLETNYMLLPSDIITVPERSF